MCGFNASYTIIKMKTNDSTSYAEILRNIASQLEKHKIPFEI